MIFASTMVSEYPTPHNTHAPIISATSMQPPSKHVENHVSTPIDTLKSHKDQLYLHRRSFGRPLPNNWL